MREPLLCEGCREDLVEGFAISIATCGGCLEVSCLCYLLERPEGAAFMVCGDCADDPGMLEVARTRKPMEVNKN